jgi:glycosyltransferase involved in cell wall biosynthesis
MEIESKKILLLSTGDVNGAYEYVYRLAKLFISDGHEVVMLVKQKSKYDDFVKVYSEFISYKRKSLFIRIIDKIKNKIKKPQKPPVVVFEEIYDFISKDETKINVSPKRIIECIGFTPDFIFSGMTDEFMNSTDLLNLQQMTNAQVYNITVDMNHFTGGCHFAWECKGYMEGCNICPAIKNEFGKDKAKINFEKKYYNAKKGNFKILTGSGWTLQQTKKSLIYKSQKDVLNINSLIDTAIFNNKSRGFARNIFNLDQNSFYILMGCQNSKNKRKGFEYLVESLNILQSQLTDSQKKQIKVLIVSRFVNDNFDSIPFEKEFIEYVNDYRLLSLLYQTANVFVNSSIEDSGPMMVSEALACGTPVVGFDMGVVHNMVISNYNGYKAKLLDSKDLSIGIKKIFELSTNEFLEYSNNATKHVEEFSSLSYAKSQIRNLLKN